MNYYQRFLGHLHTILTHKWYVFKNCVKAGIIWQGITHDLSKFSPTEFFESVKYYQGTRSPIDACKEANNGRSDAWLHHKGCNKHHFEYWVDGVDTGTVTPIEMPFKYALELVCDYLGAGQAYQKKNFTYKGELEWWYAKQKSGLKMDLRTREFVTIMLNTMAACENNNVLRKNMARQLWDKCPTSKDV